MHYLIMFLNLPFYWLKFGLVILIRVLTRRLVCKWLKCPFLPNFGWWVFYIFQNVLFHCQWLAARVSLHFFVAKFRKKRFSISATIKVNKRWGNIHNFLQKSGALIISFENSILLSYSSLFWGHSLHIERLRCNTNINLLQNGLNRLIYRLNCLWARTGAYPAVENLKSSSIE